MAIIYTYPVKSGVAVSSDLIIISDSQDKNKTKQISVSQLPGGSASGVDSIIAGQGGITLSPTSGVGNVTINIPEALTIGSAENNAFPKFKVTTGDSAATTLVDSDLIQQDRGISVLASNTPTPGNSGTEIVLAEEEKPGGSIVVGSTLTGSSLNGGDLTSTVITAINTAEATGLISYTLADAVQLNQARVTISSGSALVQLVTQRPTSGIENSGTITGTVGVTSGLTTSGSGTGATVSVVTNSSGSVDDLTIVGATTANGYAVGDTITATSTFLTGANQSLIVTLKNTSFVEQVGGVSYPPTQPVGLYYPTLRLTNTTSASGPFDGGPSPGFGWKNEDVVGSFETFTTDGSTPGLSPVSYIRSKINVANQYYPVSGLSFGITRWDNSTPRFEQGANLEAMSLSAYYKSAAPYVYITNENNVTLGDNAGNRLTINSGRSNTTGGTEIIQESSLRFLSQSLQTTWPASDSVLSVIDTYTEDGTKILSYIKTVANVAGTSPNGELIFGTSTSGEDAITRMRLNDDGRLEITGDISVVGSYIDTSGNKGTNGQYLISKGSSGTEWQNGASGTVTQVAASAGMLTTPSTGIITTGSVSLNYATSGENPNYIKVASTAEAGDNADIINVSRTVSGVDTVLAIPIGALPFNNSTFTAGNGLTLSGNVFSLTTPVSPADGGTGLTNTSTLLNSNINYSTDGSEGSVLPVIHGGTGAQNFNSFGILYGNGSNAVAATDSGTTGQVLISQGNAAAPIWGNASSSGGGGGKISVGSSGTSSGLTTALVAVTNSETNETVLTSNSYNGGDAVGHVPSGGTNAQVYLDGTGNWSVPGGESSGGGVTGIIVGSNTITGGITFTGAITRTGNTIDFTTTSTAYTAGAGLELIGESTTVFALKLTTSTNYIKAGASSTDPVKTDIVAFSPSRSGAAHDNDVQETTIDSLVDSYFTGTDLTIGKGGTGAGTFSNNQVLLSGSGASTGSGSFTTAGSGTSGQVLTSNGSTSAPTWQTAPAGNSGTVTSVSGGTNISITGTASVNPVVNLSGNIPVNNLNGGSNAGTTTFWRGDGSWASVPPGDSGVTQVTVSTPLTGGGGSSTGQSAISIGMEQNTNSKAGYVTAPNNDANKFWGTGGDGNPDPDWRDPVDGYNIKSIASTILSNNSNLPVITTSLVGGQMTLGLPSPGNAERSYIAGMNTTVSNIKVGTQNWQMVIQGGLITAFANQG
jgi:hypothetical protein